MNKFVSCLILFFTLLAGAVEGQKSTRHSIPWDADRKLVWSDFRGTPQPHHQKVAATQYQIGYEYSLENNEFIFDVTCEFIPRLSWVAERGETDYILEHEQKHFDLAEIYARKLRKELQEADINIRNYQRMTNAIYDKVWRECQLEQMKYDEETNHSIIADEQERWNDYIEDQLYLYEDYKVNPYDNNLIRRQ